MRRLLLVPLLAVALTGCTGSSSDTASDSGEAAAGGSAVDRAVAAPAVAAVPGAQSEPLRGRSLVRTAELRVRVDDVRPAADRAAATVRGAGGVLTGEQATAEQATLELRVPPARLDAVLAQLAGLGEEVDRQVGTEDVTEQVVDLDSRLATQRASVARVRTLLERASSLGDVVKVEGELAKREAELESLDARARALGARVELAAVVLHLDERRQVAAAATGFGDGLDAGWSAFTAGARVSAAALGALLPFLPLLLLAAVVVRWRRSTQRA